ncbi:PepSY-associated TM helix domain-containing protein [Mucilaginibacter agri]|uniref:PepSY domain-containing protein n=1 Tax=Mucilaginibacter agri TaxID=2695265 RepID=A0A965ZKX1_9SPHI|nr:PepSY-associated TM helix domain-containing protein [Mucilaginibacter agri]NCD71849.1 PepSY domain-containing protein [Mucilaginibacter agri]
MKTFKNITGWLHLWLGLAAGIILIIVALTGSLLTFEDELEPLIFHKTQVVKVSGTRIPVDSLVQIANSVFPDKKLSRLIIPQEAERSVEARIGAKGEKGIKVVYIDPYTGKVLGKGPYDKQFFQQVRSLHRYLLMGKQGKIVTGISCAICLFLVISGLIIWWPANKAAMKQRFKIKWNASGKRLTWDLHAVSGFYMSIVLLFITFTGFVWSYDWVEDMLFKVIDGKVEKAEKVKNKEKTKVVNDGVYQLMYNEINTIYPYNGSVAFAMPAKPALATTVQKEPEESRIRQVDAAFFDSHTGGLIKKLPYSEVSTGTKVRRMILPIHTGSLLGWPTKLLYLLVSLFTASLPITGMLIWLGKRKKTKKKTKKSPRVAVA